MVNPREITLEEFHSKAGYSKNNITFTKRQMEEYKIDFKKECRKELKENIIKKINNTQ